jgi:hypothetical protein
LSEEGKRKRKRKDNAEAQRRRGFAEKNNKDKRLLTVGAEGSTQRTQSRHADDG